MIKLIKKKPTFEDLKVMKILLKNVINSKHTFLEKLKMKVNHSRFNLFCMWCFWNNFYFIMDDNKLLGYGVVRFNKIRGFFIRPENQNQGFGSKLLSFIEQDIFKNYDMIFLKSTENYQRFYFKNNYHYDGQFMIKNNDKTRKI